MMNSRSLSSFISQGLLALVILAGLAALSQVNYLLFHSLAELFSVLVAWMIFALAWSSRSITDQDYLLFTGIALLYIGSLELVHTLAYKGMGVFADQSANLATQLWIAARYLQAISLLAAPFFLRRRVPVIPVITAYTLVSVLLLLSIFTWNIFPVCFVEPTGVTRFKTTSEYLIMLILLLAMTVTWRKRADLDRRVGILMLLAMLASVASELSFSEYVSVYGPANLLGHLLKIVAFYLIFQAIYITGLVEPYALLFRTLKRSEESLKELAISLEDRVAERTAELSLANTELGLYRDHLEQLVTERTTELERENAVRRQAEEEASRTASRLQVANRELNDFASIASHDLQDPLRKISAFGERLRRVENLRGDPEAQDLLTRMLHSASRMQEMVAGLLEYSRVTIRTLPFEPVDLNRVVAEASADLELVIEQQAAAVEVQGPLPVVEGDPVQLRQLVQNLLANALKFHRPGVPPRVHISADSSDGWVELAMRDEGIGFDPRFNERLFQPFQRLVGNSEFEGSGIGLATCRKIVERHGGSIRAEGRPGAGSTFTVRLPALQARR